MTLDLPGLVNTYGYAAVFVGAFLEGETILALAGFAAHRGYLDFWAVSAVAMVAGFLGNQFYFYLGRVRGTQILARFPNAQERAHRFDAMLARWHAPLIIVIRLVYGLSILGPILLGMGRVSWGKFVVYNFIGAALWAPMVAGIGYLFGTALEAILADMRRLQIAAFFMIVGLAAAAIAWQVLRARRNCPPRRDEPRE